MIGENLSSIFHLKSNIPPITVMVCSILDVLVCARIEGWYIDLDLCEQIYQIHGN